LNSDAFDPEELEFAASEIEREAELALADLDLDSQKRVWPPEPVRSLSAREIQVLNLVSNGLPDKQIAKLLGISTFTVNKHVGAILVKMQAGSRTEASVRAIMEGFVHPQAS
jgi:DNA-binding NarL/FixJ family response regulator